MKMKFGLQSCKAIVAVTMLISASAYAGPPAQSGVVVRFDTPEFAVIVDQKAGLIAVFGSDPVDLCSGIVDFDTFRIMAVDIQADPERIAIFAKGEVRASIWDFVEFRCDQFLTQMPLADGMATLQTTDNDFFVSSAPNNNPFGFSAHGKLVNPATGARMNLNAVFKAIYDKDTDEETIKISKITLR